MVKHQLYASTYYKCMKCHIFKIRVSKTYCLYLFENFDIVNYALNRSISYFIVEGELLPPAKTFYCPYPVVPVTNMD